MHSLQLITISCFPNYNLYISLLYPPLHITAYTAHYSILFSIMQSLQLITISCFPNYNLYISLLYPPLHITTYTAH